MGHLVSMSFSKTAFFFYVIIYYNEISLRYVLVALQAEGIRTRIPRRIPDTYLADLILVEGSITPTKAKACTHQSLNLVGKGVNAIHSGDYFEFQPADL
jgi:hypothetical protein